MKPIDKNYLSLQFWNKIYQKNATEFQGFFEDIMEMAYSDFQKIRPYGNKGDGGNDGFRPIEGIYYQVYAPINPNEKEADAVKKLKIDFKHLRENWDQISKIKTYYFVFNDKGGGSTLVLEEALAELKNDNPSIEFKIFTSKSLEELFFKLNTSDILTLGFDVDTTKAIGIANEYLNALKIELDRGNDRYVLSALSTFQKILITLEDEILLASHQILEARTLLKLERMKEARTIYESLCKRYPNDPYPFLYLAEMYLEIENFKKNEELLQKAEQIDGGHWLLEFGKIIRKIRLGDKIDVSKINEQNFPSEPKTKANYYRLYSFILFQAGEQAKAESFIERAIKLYPDSYSNYEVKLMVLKNRIYSNYNDRVNLNDVALEYLVEIETVEQQVIDWGVKLGPRNQSLINFRKISAYRAIDNYSEIEKLAKESFQLLMQCYFDHLIDKLLTELLMFFGLPQKEFEELLQYLQVGEKAISDELAKALVLQFIFKKNLMTEGKKFFSTVRRKNILDFIINMEAKKYDKVWDFLKNDFRFAVSLANTAKEYPDLRRLIIEKLPNDGRIQKEMLLLLLNYDEKNINEAFHLLKNLDLSKLRYFECKTILEIAQEKKAWDFVIEILGKLLQHEKENRIVLQLKLQLFTANINLEKFPEAIRIGEEILSDIIEIELLDDLNKESLLWQTIKARLERGEYVEAKDLMEKHQNRSKSFEFKGMAAADVYIKNNDARKAIESIVAGIKVLKNPTPEQYGSLFMLFTVIGNMIDFPLTPLELVEVNCYVKFKDQDRWFFVGDDEELDATKISSPNEKYSKFINKKIGDKVLFDDRYHSEKKEYTIENILKIDKYILWQCMQHAQKLTHEHRWDAMEEIEVPTTGETIDIKYIIARLEDEHKKREDIFNLYCKNNLPLAFLALSEGGLTNAIGRIVNENKGFIQFSSGDVSEINQQKEIAKKIIEGKEFYIDATSALVLSETGLLVEIYAYIPNLKIPQSVITLLLHIKEKFSYTPGRTGHIGYAQGKLIFSPVDREKESTIQMNFSKCIKLIESKPQNIGVISNANKSDCFSEEKIPSELCDACILARNNDVPILTEDFLYLKANEIETKKKAPKYCSTFALVRVLYEQKKISFDQYLDFFSYLSSYRFRFLPLNTEDLVKAAFGDGGVIIVRPEKIRLLNLPLTLSEDYGVTFDTALRFVVHFLIKFLVDDSILPGTVERIFAETLSTFPTDKNKKTVGVMILRISVQVINNLRQNLIVGTRVHEKIDLLTQVTELFNKRDIIIKP